MLQEQLDELGPYKEVQKQRMMTNKRQSLPAESSQMMQVAKMMMTTTLISLLHLNFYFKNIFLFLK